MKLFIAFVAQVVGQDEPVYGNCVIEAYTLPTGIDDINVLVAEIERHCARKSIPVRKIAILNYIEMPE